MKPFKIVTALLSLLSVGGVQEVTLMVSAPAGQPKLSPGEEAIYIYLRQRTGMVAMALEHKVPLVPCFCFNQRQTYSVKLHLHP